MIKRKDLAFIVDAADKIEGIGSRGQLMNRYDPFTNWGVRPLFIRCPDPRLAAASQRGALLVNAVRNDNEALRRMRAMEMARLPRLRG